jgi:hypothetical protein
MGDIIGRILFWLSGIYFIIISLYSLLLNWHLYLRKEYRIEVEAIVVNKIKITNDCENPNTYRYVFQYNINGKIFEIEYLTKNSECIVGGIYRVYCNKKNPNRIKLAKDVFWNILFNITLLVIGIAGIYIIIR